MAGDKYLKNSSGAFAEQAAIQSSAGAGDAGKIGALDGTGRWDPTMMPVGVVADTASVTASEALSAGDFVNIFNSSGAKARKADASTSGKEADGFVLSAVLISATALVYFEGTNTQVTGATPGTVFLSDTTPGGFTSIAPVGTGKVVQRLGVATAATAINYERGPAIQLA